MLGERLAVLVPVEERRLDLGPVRRVRDRVDERGEEDGRREQREGDGATGAATPEDLRLAAQRYLRTGAPVTLASQICWIRFSTPVRFMFASALLTQATSGLPLLEDHPEALLAPRRRELADDLAVRHLHRRDVERGRQVDDEAVDLAVLERRDRRVVRVVDRDGRRGLDGVDDVLVARRPELGAELVLLQARLRAHRGDRLALEADDRLVDVVVRGAEAEHLRPLGRVRDLVDVEVERLLARRDRLVEGRVDPDDLALGEAEPLRDRVRDRRLEALALGGVVDLPRPALRLAAREPRRERRVVGADRELPVLDEVEVRLGAAAGRRRRRPRFDRRMAAAAIASAITATGIRTLRMPVSPLVSRLAKQDSNASTPRYGFCNGVAVRRARGRRPDRQGDEPGQGALSGAAARRSGTSSTTTSRSARGSCARSTSGRRSCAASRTASRAR